MERVNITYQGGDAADMLNNYHIMTDIVSRSGIRLMDTSFDLSLMDRNDVQKFVKSILKINRESKGTNDLIMTYSLILDGTQRWKRSIHEFKKIMPQILMKKVDPHNASVQSNCACFRSEGIYCALLVSAGTFQGALKLYNQLLSCGAPIVVERFNDYASITEDDFKGWAFQTDGSGISIFTDMLSTMFLDYGGSNCEHSSCLSRNYYISLDGGISCCKHALRPRVSTIYEIESIQDILSCPDFIQTLEKAVDYREKCQSECPLYNFCQGGCPLNIPLDNSLCGYKEYCSLYNSVLAIAADVVKHVNYNNLNPAFRSIILSSAASNKLLKKCRIE